MAKKRTTGKKVGFQYHLNELQAEIGRKLTAQEQEFFVETRNKLAEPEWDNLFKFIKAWVAATHDQLGKALQMGIPEIVAKFQKRQKWMPTDAKPVTEATGADSAFNAIEKDTMKLMAMNLGDEAEKALSRILACTRYKADVG